ncbi:ABC transporter ATP-binding protein [Neobacillus notoginsengisoli]|uniref:ABC transporter ATP-binding protein n=1 Tax=Neobacillus notoginsengisoli TaxID=1578198 RepID=A0A417YPU4_9BACI|nr:ABC transporter ATP-binding protein [Neobacillus notoginsengisoli]RHW35699.1 ABC transporter ATP-binding protein [Neobacillus notoginsengisoli]
MELVLEAVGINKSFGSRGNVFPALHNIDFRIEKGEFTAVMGPSGAGKTTLLNILSTIDDPTSGTIRINGMTVQGFKEEELSRFRQEQLGFIFQDYNLLDTLTIEENISLPLALANIPPVDINHKTGSIARAFGIETILTKYPYEVSGGQQQRASAARALVTNPSIVFADEPTGALDSKSAHTLLQTLEGINKQQGSTILMVTHDPTAASFCNRVVFIKDGTFFTELRKGGQTRKQFFQQVVNVLAALGGGQIDAD